MIRTQSDHANTELIQELTENTVTGGVAMINHALAELMDRSRKSMHCSCMIGIWPCWQLPLGSSVYIDQADRIVPSASVAMFWELVPLENGLKTGFALIFLFAKYWNLIESSQEQAKNLLDLPVSSQNKEIIENFVTIMDVPLKERLRRIRQYGYR